MRKLIAAVCFLAVAAGLSGCGSPKPYSIDGKVTRGGEKLTWPNGGSLLVIYFPEDRVRDPKVYSAETDTATCTYKIAAIPPGRYTVAVQQFDPKFMDALHEAYDPVRTELIHEVAQDGQTIDIDLPKGGSTPAATPKGKGKGNGKGKDADLPPPG